MSDTNKVVKMIEQRAERYANQKKVLFHESILNNLQGCNSHQCYSHIVEHVKQDDFTLEHVSVIINALLKACYEKHYESHYDSEVKNISQMLSFMQNELESKQGE